MEDADDGAVWRLDDQRALIVTTDFFTPVVDDAYDFGQIAAANALSDIYAMGGNPFLALNVAALPPNLPTEVSAEILRGGADKCLEADTVVAGGHTIQDMEPKFGLVVLGFLDSQKMFKKSGITPGDALILTKPLGFGVITTALKQQKADADDVQDVTLWMKKLNRDASRLGIKCNVKSGTDITGFGFLGHAYEMALASGVGFDIWMDAIPFLSSSRKYARAWTFPGGASDNRLFFGPQVQFDQRIKEEEQMLLFDPQTSGGLLLALSADDKDTFLSQAVDANLPVWVIGEAVHGSGIRVI